MAAIIKVVDMKRPDIARERGSIAVLIALLIPVMLLMIALVLDIGQLVFEKIRLQNTVDTCALVAANVQSIGLNEIADLNAELINEHQKLRVIIGKGVWHSASEARKAIRFYETVMQNIILYQNQANTGYAQMAEVFAEKVKVDNLPEASLRWIGGRSTLTSMTPNFDVMEYAYYTMTCSSSPLSWNYCPPGPVLLWSDPDDPEFVGHHDGSRTELRARKLMSVSILNMVERYAKEGETYAWLEIQQEAQPYILGSRRFGYLPALRAYAKAKPAGGSIYDREAEYRPVLVK